MTAGRGAERCERRAHRRHCYSIVYHYTHAVYTLARLVRGGGENGKRRNDERGRTYERDELCVIGRRAGAVAVTGRKGEWCSFERVYGRVSDGGVRFGVGLG